jgi:hypothetical protein
MRATQNPKSLLRDPKKAPAVAYTSTAGQILKKNPLIQRRVKPPRLTSNTPLFDL